jgi:hypothetical protein
MPIVPVYLPTSLYLLTLMMTQQKLGLYWERNQIEHDKTLNKDAVFFTIAHI